MPIRDHQDPGHEINYPQAPIRHRNDGLIGLQASVERDNTVKKLRIGIHRMQRFHHRKNPDHVDRYGCQGMQKEVDVHQVGHDNFFCPG